MRPPEQAAKFVVTQAQLRHAEHLGDVLDRKHPLRRPSGPTARHVVNPENLSGRLRLTIGHRCLVAAQRTPQKWIGFASELAPNIKKGALPKGLTGNHSACK